jgi:aminopeptidase N
LTDAPPQDQPAEPAPSSGPSRRWILAAIVTAAALVVGLAVWQPWADDEPGTADTTTTSASTPSTEEPPEAEPGAPGIGDPYYPGLGNGGFDVEHYGLDLTWLADEGVLEGVTTIEATATQDLSRFNLDLHELQVRAVTVEGEPAQHRHEGRELVIEPTEHLAEGTTFTAVVSYGGVPVPIDEGTDIFDLGWHRDGREAFVVSEPSGAQTFFPVSDHPSDKATYTIRVTAPEDLTVAANGLLVSENDTGHGTRSWTYEARDPMASYLVQVAIGDLELVDAGTVGGVPVRHALHRALGDAAHQYVESTADMITMLAEVFGPYPFEAIGVLAVDEPLGFALETQTLPIFGSDLIGGMPQEILLHELAHQWVGDAVSPATWQDIWLNEGFATYAEWLWLERTGVAPAAETARRYDGLAQLDAPPPGDPGPNELFTGTVYIRGGMTLQALREQVGDDAFFEILRRWIAEQRDGTASTFDLIGLAQAVSGQQLGGLFQSWLYGDDLPDLP